MTIAERSVGYTYLQGVITDLASQPSVRAGLALCIRYDSVNIAGRRAE
jgi:hypothetical protein